LDETMSTIHKAKFYEGDCDYLMLKKWLKKLREELALRIMVWWNSFNHDIEYNNFDKCLDEVVYEYGKRCIQIDGNGQ
jgi:hypothetical protein